MLKLLENSIAISQKILSHCQNNEWQEVDALQTQRHSLMAKIATTALPVDDNQLKQCGELTNELRSLCNEIETLSKKEKDNVFKEIKTNNTSKKMNSAYKL